MVYPDEIEIPQAAEQVGAPEGIEEGQPQEVAAATTTNNDFNPENYGVTFRGQEVRPKDRNHLNELIQMGHSYSHNKEKYQGLEAENQRLNGQFQQYSELDKALNQYPELQTQMNGVWENFQNGQNQQQQPELQQDPVLMQRIESIEAKNADDALSTELNNLQAKFPTHPWDKDTGEGTFKNQLLNFMLEKGISDTELAYKAYTYNDATKQSAFVAAKQTTQGIQAQHKAGVVAQGTAIKPPAKAWNSSGKTYDQAEDYALSRINN